MMTTLDIRRQQGVLDVMGKLIETKGPRSGMTVDVSCDLCHYPIQVQ